MKKNNLCKMEIELLMKTLQSFGSELDEVRKAQRKIESNSQVLSFTQNIPNKPCENIAEKPVGLTNGASHTQEQNNCKQIEMPIEIVTLSQKIEELYIKFNLISTTISKLETSIDDLEQYGRRNCLIVHGLTDLPNARRNYWEFVEKLVTKINCQMNLNLSSEAVDIAHPLPVAKNGKAPIIIKFIRRSDRNTIFHRKRYLAGTGMAVTESLTKKRLALMNEAKGLLGEDKVWSYNGSIFCNINTKKVLIKSQKNLYEMVASL